TNQNIPPGLERIVRHCLEKNPEERFHSAHDLAFDLQALSGASVPAARPLAPERTRARGLARAGLTAAVLLAVGVAAFLVGQRSAERPLPSFRRLTFHRGSIPSARFAPDPQTLVSSARWAGNSPAIFLGRPGTSEAPAIPIPEALLASVSPEGELAILLSPRQIRGFTASGTLARAALSGGAPRELSEDIQWADWIPGGQQIATVRDAGGKNRLEFPIGKPVSETAGWISHPRVSPRGDRVAFLDHPAHGDDGGFVAVVDAAGTKRVLAGPFSTAFGLAWAPDASAICFTAAPGGNTRALRAVTLDGKESLLARAPGILTLLDMAPGGRAIVSVHDIPLRITSLPPPQTPTQS